MDPIVLILGLGLVAGVLTTVAGIGGGLLATVVLAAAVGPHQALAITAPALLVGNVHRLWLFRHHVDRDGGLRLAGPALIGAMVGGTLAIDIPESVLRWLLLGVTGLALLRTRAQPQPILGRLWLPVGGLLAGLLAATTGGGGLVVAPLMLGAGMRDATFLATGAAIATAIHLARLGAYGTTGLLTPTLLGPAIALGVAILAGNELGRRLRPRLHANTRHRLTWVVLFAGVGLAIAGLGPAVVEPPECAPGPVGTGCLGEHTRGLSGPREHGQVLRSHGYETKPAAASSCSIAIAC